MVSSGSFAYSEVLFKSSLPLKKKKIHDQGIVAFQEDKERRYCAPKLIRFE